MFRFTIRDMLWLTVVVALVCGWLSDRMRLRLSLAVEHDKGKHDKGISPINNGTYPLYAFFMPSV
jgi:hypothetical protein